MCFVVIKYSKKQKLYFITWTSMLLLDVRRTYFLFILLIILLHYCIN